MENNDVFLPKGLYDKYSRASLINLIKEAYNHDIPAGERQLKIFEEQSHTEYVTEFLFELADKVYEVSRMEELVPGSSYSSIKTWILNRIEN